MRIVLIALIGVCAFWSMQTTVFAQAGSGLPDDVETRVETSGIEQFRIGELIGKTAKNEQGQVLGTVEEVIANEDGQINYLIVSVDGALGLTERWTPVPWQAADVRVQRDSIIVRLSKNQLQNAPSFGKGNVPDFSRLQVRERINSYYGMDRMRDRDAYRNEQRRYSSRDRYEPSREDSYFGEYESYRHDDEFERGRDRDRYRYDQRNRPYGGRYDQDDDYDDSGYRDRNSGYRY